MPVVSAPFCTRARAVGDQVRIIEPDKTITIGTVQCQRIPEPMRTFEVNLNPADFKLDPEPLLRINKERLPIQVE